MKRMALKLISSVLALGLVAAAALACGGITKSQTTAEHDGGSSTAGSDDNPTTQTSRGASSNLAGTSWDLLSMTEKGQQERVNSTTPNVQFCHDGTWAILHSAGNLEGGKYQMQGSRLVMKYEDGSLYGDYQIKRSGDEMILDDGHWVLRLKYYGPVKC